MKSLVLSLQMSRRLVPFLASSATWKSCWKDRGLLFPYARLPSSRSNRLIWSLKYQQPQGELIVLKYNPTTIGLKKLSISPTPLIDVTQGWLLFMFVHSPPTHTPWCSSIPLVLAPSGHCFGGSQGWPPLQTTCLDLRAPLLSATK